MHWNRAMLVATLLTVGLLSFAHLLTAPPPIPSASSVSQLENPRLETAVEPTPAPLLPPSPFPRNPWPQELETDPAPLDRAGSAGSPETEQEPDLGANHPSPTPEMPASETAPVHAAAPPVHKPAPVVHKRRPPATQARLAVPQPPPPDPDSYAPVSTWRAPEGAIAPGIPWRWPTALVRTKPADHDWRSRALGGAL